METKTVETSAIWYHVSTWSGDSASRWALGAARKGNYDGKRNISVIQFSASDLADAIGDGVLNEAELVLRRDATFGTAAINVSLAPANVSGSLQDKYMSRNQCLELADRALHKRYTIQGETAAFKITGAVLREIKAGNVNAFMLYQETDGTDSYCRLSTNAVMNLYIGTDELATPSWTRTVSTGDVISSDIYSHIADLREIEYYINLRRMYDGLQAMADIGASLDVGAYADWADVILALQAGADGFLNAEEREIEWIRPETGQVPDAEIIEQLKSSVGGEDAKKNTADGFYAVQEYASATASYNKARTRPWVTEDLIKAGVTKESIPIQTGSPDAPRTTTIWHMHVCGWVWDGLGSRTVASALVELTVKKSEEERPHLTLYGIRPGTAPVSATYNSVFYEEVIGEADANVGELTRIGLNARGLQLINTGVIHGVGLRYDNDYVEIAKTAAIITSTLEINEDPEQET